jgi:hypothetical protein
MENNTQTPENLQHDAKLPVMWRFFSRFSMRKVTSLFMDVVNGQVVNLYVDRYGIEWMAQSKYGFRCRRNAT